MGFASRRQRPNEPVRQPKMSGNGGESLFRRSRTLTGSMSSRIASATEAASQLRSPRLKEHDLRAHRRKLSAGLVIALGISLSLLGLLRGYVSRLEVVDTQGGKAQSYVRYIDTYLNSHPLERFLPLLNTTSLNRFVVSKVPELERVDIRDSGFFSDTASVTYRTAVAKWQLNNVMYYVDKNGVAFSKKPAQEPALTIKDESGLPIAAQQKLSSSKMLTFIGKTVGALTSEVGAVKEVVIPPATLKQVDLVLDKYPYRIRTNSDREPVGQAIDIKNAINHLNVKGITPSYLDVRVEGKAFYKQ